MKKRPTSILNLILVTGVALMSLSCSKSDKSGESEQEASVDTQKVENVMTFLKNGDINSGPYTFFGEEYFNSASDFSYDANEKSLSFIYSIQSPNGTSYYETVFYVDTAKPVVQIETVESSPETSRVTLTGKAKDRGAGSKEELSKATYKDAEETDVSLLVNKDIGPRLKAAFDDLLKAHGIEVSEY